MWICLSHPQHTDPVGRGPHHESFLNFLAVFWDTNTLLSKKMHMKVLKNFIFHSRWYLIPFSEYNSSNFWRLLLPFFLLLICVLCLQLWGPIQKSGVHPYSRGVPCHIRKKEDMHMKAQLWESMCLEEWKLRKSEEFFMWNWNNYWGLYRSFQKILIEGMEKVLMQEWVRG